MVCQLNFRVCVLWLLLSTTRLIEFQTMLTYLHASTFWIHFASETFVMSG